MRKTVLALVAATALTVGSAASAAITIDGTTSSTGSTATTSALDNSGMPETFAFLTQVTDGGVSNPYTSSIDFHNNLWGSYTFILGTASGTLTLAEVLDNGTLSVIASTSGPSPALVLTTPVLTANALYRFTYSGNLLNNGKISGNASFTQAVPEPGTWAMMLLGFGGIGFAMRRRRRPVLAQVA